MTEKRSQFIPWKTKDRHASITAFTQMNYIKNNKSLEIFSNLKKSLLEKDTVFLNNKRLITHNDFFFLHDLTDIESLQLIQTFLPPNSEFYTSNILLSKKGLEYISSVVQEAIDFYQRFLLRTIDSSLIQKWKSQQHITFKNTQEVVDFLSQATKSKNKDTMRQMYCSLLKIMYSVHYMKQNPQIFQKEKLFEKIIAEHLFSHLNDKNNHTIKSDFINQSIKSYDNISLTTKPEILNQKPIHFKSSGRIKENNKILVKLIGNPKYDDIEAIKDIFWTRNEVKSKTDGIMLLEYFSFVLFHHHCEIKNKGFIIPEECFEIKKYLSEEFYEKLIHSLDPTRTAWKTHIDYKDIKLIGKINNEEIEIQIVLVNNKNESWYAHHGIYDCIKRIECLVRIQWYITETMINRYILNAIDTYKNDLTPLWAKNIFEYFLNEKTLVKMSIPDQNNTVRYYTTLERRNEFHQEWSQGLYPAWAQIFVDGSWTSHALKTNKKTS